MKAILNVMINMTTVIVKFLEGLPIVGSVLKVTLKYANISNPAELLVFLIILGLVTLIPGPFNVPFAIGYGRVKKMIMKRMGR